MTSDMNQLPAVAKSLFTFCKKCDGDRYHRVLAHVSSTSAKVQCEVCGARKTYSLPKKTTSVRSANASLARTAKAATKAAESARGRASQHREQYEMLLQSYASDAAQNYSIKVKFDKNGKVEHPKFGLGVILQIHPDKVEVIFQDEVRQLVHNRS